MISAWADQIEPVAEKDMPRVVKHFTTETISAIQSENPQKYQIKQWFKKMIKKAGNVFRSGKTPNIKTKTKRTQET